MSTIAKFTLPAESFSLGSIFENRPEITVELERMVPTDAAIIPYLWVHGNGSAQKNIEAEIENCSEVRSAQLLDEVSGDSLFRLEWETAHTGILQAIEETPVVLQSATGNSQQWEFEIRGDKQEFIATFQEYCHDHHIPIRLISLHSLARIDTGTEYELTDTQREALVLAFQRGYYQSPRETTLLDLADELGITGQAFGARLRGGTHHLIGSTLIDAHSDN